MQKGWWFFFAVAAGLFGAGIVWGLLIDPRPLGLVVSGGTAIEFFSALSAFGTLAVAIWAAATWKSQIRGNRDADLGRRLAVQLCKCEDHAARLIGLANFGLARVSIAPATNYFDTNISKTAIEDMEKCKQDVQELRSTLLEVRALWVSADRSAFDQLLNVLYWAFSCCELYHRTIHGPVGGMVTPQSQAHTLLKQAKKLGVDKMESPQLRDIEPMLERARSIIRSHI